jgi:hypothetical protein
MKNDANNGNSGEKKHVNWGYPMFKQSQIAGKKQRDQER